MTGNKLHYADLLITCSNHQRCKDDPLPCTDDTHGKWQVPVKPASCANAACYSLRLYEWVVIPFGLT